MLQPTSPFHHYVGFLPAFRFLNIALYLWRHLLRGDFSEHSFILLQKDDDYGEDCLYWWVTTSTMNVLRRVKARLGRQLAWLSSWLGDSYASKARLCSPRAKKAFRGWYSATKGYFPDNLKLLLLLPISPFDHYRDAAWWCIFRSFLDFAIGRNLSRKIRHTFLFI